MPTDLAAPLAGVVSLFLVIASGTALRLLKIADESWCDVMNRFALYIGFPCLLFLRLAGASMGDWQGFPMLLLIVGISLALPLGLSYFGAWAIWKDRVKALSFAAIATYGNVAYLGYPVTTKVFPELEASIGMIVTAHILVFFTLVVGMMEWQSGDGKPSVPRMVRRILTNPFIIAMAAGFVFSLFGWKVPGIIHESMDLIGRSVTAVVLVSLGIYLGSGSFAFRESGSVWFVAAIKLIIMPLMALGLASLLTDRPGPIVLEAAMPSAVTVYALSSLYRLDKKLLSGAISLTAVLSLVSLPIWVIILGLIK